MARELEGGRKLALELGDYEYVLVPQRWGYLQAKLPKAASGLDNLDPGDMNDLIGMLGRRAYHVLKVFIPSLMPEYEFMGYPSQEKMDAGEYDEAHDKSPDPGQVIDAFEAAAKVNRIDLVKHLGKLIGPELIRAWLAGILRQNLENRDTRLSEHSSAEPIPATPSTTSGTNGPTSNEKKDLLSPAS